MRDEDQQIIKFDHEKNMTNEDFYLSKSKDGNSMLLNCTGIFRAQAVDIMPKNFFFVYKILEVINEMLNSQAKQKYLIGSYTHFVTILVPTRYD